MIHQSMLPDGKTTIRHFYYLRM